MHRVALASLTALLLLALPGSDPEGPPYAPDEALGTFRLADGFRIEPFAAEPHVQDPVAMTVDEAGRVYVAEMPGYPLDTGGSGRVKRLEDTDGDGVIDQSTLFADGLVLPTGLMRWKDGLLVTDAPDVLFLADRDGDGQAEHREVVLTGFARSNPQHNFNDPTFALDGWVHLANNGAIWWTEDYKDAFGDRGGKVYFPARPDGPRLGRNALDHNVRFRPDAFALEALSSGSQFGRTFDAGGHRFSNDNTHPAYHEVVAARYLARAPDLPVREATHDLPTYGVPPAVYPITKDPEHQLLTDRGVMTSAAGITWYLGGLFPEPFSRVTFHAEPVHNLVHAALVEPQGATFTARRLLEGREFLASEDAWFRPVNFYVGPDGALYVIDYYRQIVEHPEWMDEATRRSDALWNGTDRGRIWRVVPERAEAAAWVDGLDLGEANAARLVALLDHENAWWRLNAQRLLLDRRPPEAAPLLTDLVQNGATAGGRLHALHTLDALGALTPDVLRAALHDEAADVRESAIALAEARLATDPSLADALLARVDDPDPRVRFQLLLTLGELTSEAARAARGDLLYRDLEDPWVPVAALTARDAEDHDRFAEAVRRLAGQETDGRRRYVRLLGAAIGAREEAAEIRDLLARTSAEGAAWWRAAALHGLADGLRGRRTDALDAAALTRAFFAAGDEDPARGDADLRDAYLALLQRTGLPSDPDVAARAIALATDRAADPSRRADALRLLALADPAPYADALRTLVDPQEHLDVQAAAVATLGAVDHPDVAPFLLDRWAAMTPPVREAALDALVRGPARQALLIDAVEGGAVHPSALGWQRRVRLMRDTEGDVRDKARALLNEDRGTREAVVERYRPALEAVGDASAGQAVFARACATCHTRGGEGVAFGPDLGTVRHWPADALLAKILVPSRSIADGYAFWFVELTDGSTAGGVIAAETAGAITLRSQGGAEQTIPRSAIRSMRAAPTSPMPSGLEHQISVDEMADLLAFLKSVER